ncbi:MAG TPA: TlpA disulfide reductase family protein [Gemmatimonadaceae bacterium]|nr:TlpA disulfide reductase family protein [Gemmatimonadaceae bacterium]
MDDHRGQLTGARRAREAALGMSRKPGFVDTRCHARARAALALILTAACGGRDRPGQIEVGLPAPAYSARTLGGQPASLADLKGRVVLLNGWATWCIPCQREVPALEKLYTTHHGEGLEIIGVNVDVGGAENRVREFMSTYNMTYPVWRDPDDIFSGVFRAYGLPASYLIGRDGILRWHQVGEVDPESPSFKTALSAALAEPAP